MEELEKTSLIKIETNENNEPVVNGRELHEILGVKTAYKDWFPRMVEYGFTEGSDYIAIAQKRATAQGNETTYTDHILKLDMAKEIAMLQRNEKGKEIRQYFIEIEKEFNSPEKVMARALRIADKTINTLKLENAQQNQIIKELKPKADYTDRILKNKSLVTTTAIAKDYGMSATTFNKILHELKIQYKLGSQWFLYTNYQDKGYTSSETVEFTRSNGMTDIAMTTKWTQKGRLFLYDELKKAGILPQIEL
jgi:anti-repressor protein